MLTTLRFLSTTNLLIMPQEVRAIFEYVFVPHNQRRQLDQAFAPASHSSVRFWPHRYTSLPAVCARTTISFRTTRPVLPLLDRALQVNSRSRSLPSLEGGLMARGLISRQASLQWRPDP